MNIKKKKKKRIMGILLIVIAILTMGYMPLAEYINSYHRMTLANNLKVKTESEPDKKLDYLLRNARAYNASLANEPIHLNEGEKIVKYDKQLNILGGETAFATIYIPKLNLQMPIYHGTTKQALQGGIGHIEESALPVGGNSTHTLLAGHSGMTDMQAFDNIRNLEHGDLIGIYTVGSWFIYEVIGSEVVKPDETDSIQIVKSRELLTLITCTPYGINTHRLLVHARRITEGYEGFDKVERPSIRKALFTMTGLPLIVALSVAVIVIVVMRQRKRGKEHEKLQKINLINTVGFGTCIYTHDGSNASHGDRNNANQGTSPNNRDTDSYGLD